MKQDIDKFKKILKKYDIEVEWEDDVGDNHNLHIYNDSLSSELFQELHEFSYVLENDNIFSYGESDRDIYFSIKREI